MNHPSTASVAISTTCPTVIAAGAFALVNPTVVSHGAVRRKYTLWTIEIAIAATDSTSTERCFSRPNASMNAKGFGEAPLGGVRGSAVNANTP